MLMKDGVARPAAERIAKALASQISDFDQLRFINQCLSPLAEMELRQRVDHFIAVLGEFLPQPFPLALDCLLGLIPHWDHGDESDPLSSFAAWPLLDYIGKYGLDYPEIALPALAKLTPLFSAEFAIRPFIVNYPQQTLAQIHRWLDDPCYHVRRLCSEGTRPRLPWGIRLQAFCDDPQPCYFILNRLCDDDSDYVRRSVANHLNDIAKDHPEAVILLAENWLREANAKRRWIVKHGCRSLIKQGYADAFPLLGFSKQPQVTISPLQLSHSAIHLGQSIQFSAELTAKATTTEKLAIDYVVYHVKANQQLSSKVFKLKEVQLAPGETIRLSKQHSIKPISTRRYYSGTHYIAIQINGQRYTKVPFQLHCD